MTKKTKANNLNVEKIMQEIQANSLKQKMQKDLQYLNSLDINKLTKPIHQAPSPKSDPTDNSTSLVSELNFVKSHRKGLISYIYNLVLIKLFTAVKIFLENALTKQERFNQTTNQTLKDLALYPELNLDYKKFEDKHRGDQASIQQKQEQYIKYFKNSKLILDIGCGRGEFMEQLQKYKIPSLGIEINEEMYQECLTKKLNVQKIDAISFLKNYLTDLSANQIDGIFCSQVIEHLHMHHIVEMLKFCYEVLNTDNYLILETINIQSLITFTSSVYCDPTHVKPIHPETLIFLLESVGFKNIEIVHSGDVPDHIKLQLIDPKNENEETYNNNINKLNNILFGPQDYAVIAKK